MNASSVALLTLGTLVLPLGVSQKKNFKCILKDHKKVPDPDCGEVEQRTHSSKMYKAKCPFPTTDGKPWEQLAKTPCSKHTKCCCDSSDDWTEHVCLEATDDVTEGRSKHQKGHGEMQKYVKTAQSYSSEGECVGNVTALPYQTSYEYKSRNHGKCCVSIEHKSKKVMTPGSCRMEGGYLCDDMECSMDANCYGGANWCGEKQVCSYETKVWAACKKFQTLFYCATDKLNPSQTRYKRVSAQKGMCMGDNTDPAVKVDSFLGSVSVQCPEGWLDKVTGRPCQCEGHCGSSR